MTSRNNEIIIFFVIDKFSTTTAAAASSSSSGSISLYFMFTYRVSSSAQSVKYYNRLNNFHVSTLDVLPSVFVWELVANRK